MVFQVPNPLPLSLRKNITLPLELTLGMGKREAEERMEQSLRRAGLWDEVKDRLNDAASGFSGGQQQRMCLARTLALEPDILLLRRADGLARPPLRGHHRNAARGAARVHPDNNGLPQPAAGAAPRRALLRHERGENREALTRGEIPDGGEEGEKFLESLL